VLPVLVVLARVVVLALVRRVVRPRRGALVEPGRRVPRLVALARRAPGLAELGVGCLRLRVLLLLVGIGLGLGLMSRVRLPA
jgi:hypothetical protein